MRRTINTVILAIILSPSLLFAQEVERSCWSHRLSDWVIGKSWEYNESIPMTHNKVIFQRGQYGVIDEYLSPISHFGVWNAITAITDFAPRKGHKWHLYQEVMLSYAAPKNKANGTTMQVLRGEYMLGPSWRLYTNKGFAIDVAPLINMQLQAIYKSSNTNNYTNTKFSTGLDGWLRLKYLLPFKAYKPTIAYSLQFSLMHATFHPEYGQNYYEYISGEEHSPLKFHFTSLHNNFTLRQRILIDLPINSITLTIGAEYYHQKQLLSQTHFVQGYWGAILGISFDTFTLSGARSLLSKSVSSSFYH